MSALDAEVANAVWEAAKGLLPSREDNHPPGCHNPRKTGPCLLPGDTDPVVVSAEGDGLGDRAKASEMEHAVRHHIRARVDEYPVYHTKLSERVDEILDRLMPGYPTHKTTLAAVGQHTWLGEGR